MLVPNQKEFIFERYPSQGCFLIFYRYLDAARILRDMCICCIWQKVKETVKDVWGFLKTFLSTEHPGLNNVADFLTVIISAASIIIAFASYNYTKDHDQQIAKFAQANEISSWVMHDAKGNIQKTEDMSLMKVSIDNGSDQPIYDVVLTSVSISRGRFRLPEWNGFHYLYRYGPSGKIHGICSLSWRRDACPCRIGHCFSRQQRQRLDS